MDSPRSSKGSSVAPLRIEKLSKEEVIDLYRNLLGLAQKIRNELLEENRVLKEKYDIESEQLHNQLSNSKLENKNLIDQIDDIKNLLKKFATEQTGQIALLELDINPDLFQNQFNYSDCVVILEKSIRPVSNQIYQRSYQLKLENDELRKSFFNVNTKGGSEHYTGFQPDLFHMNLKVLEKLTYLALEEYRQQNILVANLQSENEQLKNMRFTMEAQQLENKRLVQELKDLRIKLQIKEKNANKRQDVKNNEINLIDLKKVFENPINEKVTNLAINKQEKFNNTDKIIRTIQSSQYGTRLLDDYDLRECNNESLSSEKNEPNEIAMDRYCGNSKIKSFQNIPKISTCINGLHLKPQIDNIEIKINNILQNKQLTLDYIKDIKDFNEKLLSKIEKIHLELCQKTSKKDMNLINENYSSDIITLHQNADQNRQINEVVSWDVNYDRPVGEVKSLKTHDDRVVIIETSQYTNVHGPIGDVARPHSSHDRSEKEVICHDINYDEQIKELLLQDVNHGKPVTEIISQNPKYNGQVKKVICQDTDHDRYYDINHDRLAKEVICHDVINNRQVKKLLVKDIRCDRQVKEICEDIDYVKGKLKPDKYKTNLISSNEQTILNQSIKVGFNKINSKLVTNNYELESKKFNIEQMEKKISILESDKKIMNEYEENLIQQIDELQSQIKDIRVEKLLVLQNVKDLKDNKMKLEIENKNLHLQLTQEASGHKLELDNLQIENIHLKSEIEYLQAGNIQLKEDSQNLNKKIISIEKEMTILNNDKSKLEKRYEGVIKVMEELKLQNNIVSKEQLSLIQAKQDILLQHRQQIEKLELSYKEELENAKRQIIELQNIKNHSHKKMSNVSEYLNVSALNSLTQKRKSSDTSVLGRVIPLDELLNTPLNTLNSKTIMENNITLEDDLNLETAKEQLRIQSCQLSHLMSLLTTNEQDLAKLSQMNDFLKRELRKQESEQNMHDPEYLKNIIIKFLTLSGVDERIYLVPIIQKILKLSMTEVEIFTCVAKGLKVSDQCGNGLSNLLPL